MHERGPRMVVEGGGGVELHVDDAGDPEGQPLVFIHGYCQSTYAWRKQTESDLSRDFRMVMFDMRGHGDSGKPSAPEAYKDSQLWADDVAAVLETLDLRTAIIIAWSYAGYLVGDYLRHYGADRLAAIALVSAVTVKGGEKARPFNAAPFGELFPALFSDEPDVITPAMERFIDLTVADPNVLTEDERAEILTDCELVPAVAREAMMHRKLDNDDVLRELRIPVLCVHGTADNIVLPASSEHNAKQISRSRLSIYDGIGHTPFIEDSVRFERELRELAARSIMLR